MSKPKNIIQAKRTDQGVISIRWTEPGLGGPEEHSLTSAEEPRPELHSAFIRFQGVLAHLAGTDASYTDDAIIREIAKRYDKNGDLCLTLKAEKYVLDNQVNLVVSGAHLPPETDDLLAELNAEARRYIQGERAQLQLFEERADQPLEATP